MTRAVAGTIVGLAGVVLLAGGPDPAWPRLRRCLAAPAPGRAGLISSAARLSSAARRRLVAASAGLCLLGAVGGLAGVVVGAAAAVAIDRLLAGRPDLAAGRVRETVERDLPLALDLLTCALRAGQPPAPASSAVAAAIEGPVGAALAVVGRGLGLGSPPEAAWQPLGSLPGAGSAARTLARAGGSGTRLADELTRVADDLRVRRSAASQARVRRAGVLVVLPLGLCFLPAFVCVGVVPIVIGIAGTVLR